MIEWFVGAIFLGLCLAVMGWQNLIANRRSRKYDKIIDDNVSHIEECTTRRRTPRHMPVHNQISRSSTII